MGRRRFKVLGFGTFFGDLVYQRAVEPGHFLRQLASLINWEWFTDRLIRLYQGGAEVGRPPYDPTVILKMLLLSYLYNLSERQTEVYCNDSLSAKCFLGLAVDEPAPDHSTLTAFKRRIIETGGERTLRELLAEIVATAVRQGVQFGSIQLVDSTHTVANVNVEKDERRQAKEGQEARDREARWGVKHTRRYRNEQGQAVEQKEYFYGYKTHSSMNAEAEMITSVTVTAGHAPDGKQLLKLVEQDLAQGLPVETYSGDRGYDDSENHYGLASRGLHSALKLNRYRTEKKDRNKEVWLALKQTPQYEAGQKVRYKIERKYGEAKGYHGLRRCRYLGYLRMTIQAYLTAITLNLKRLVKLVSGVNFKGRAHVAA